MHADRHTGGRADRLCVSPQSGPVGDGDGDCVDDQRGPALRHSPIDIHQHASCEPAAGPAGNVDGAGAQRDCRHRRKGGLVLQHRWGV
jgi:hypothetical protein